MSEPSFLKSASHADQYGDSMTPLQLFADQNGRRFPYHTPAACYRSAQQLGQHLDGGNYTDLIKAAATIHGIDAEVAEILEPSGGTIKYAYTHVDDKGQAHNYLPLRNSTEIQAASSYLAQYRDEIRLSERQKIASAILDAANEHGTELGNATKHALLQQAGRGECSTESLKQALLARATLLGVAPEAGPLRKMANASENRGTREVRQKLASLLDQLDQEFGLKQHYAKGLRPPEEALFELTASTLKQAAATEVPLKTGAVFSKQALERVNRRALQAWLGDGFADSVWSLGNEAEVDHVKLAAVVQTFDPPQARRFEQCAASCGAVPLSEV